MIDGSMIDFQGPVHSLGSGPMGNGATMSEAGISTLDNGFAEWDG